VARLEFANALRGLAAVSVVTSHYHSFFFGNAKLIGSIANTPPPMPVASSALDSWQAILSALPFVGGEFGVALFFLISGFVIPMSLQKYNWRGFLVGRVFRIYPTYFAGFSVTLFALWVAGSVFGKPFPYDFRAVIIHFVPGARDLAWSSNIDYVVWTLEIEVKFYIACAATWIWLRRGDRRVFVIPLAMAGCAIGVAVLLPGWLSTNVFAYQIAYRVGHTFTTISRFLTFMFIGVAFYYHHRRRLNTIALVVMSMVLLSVFWLQWSIAPNANDTLSGPVVNSYTLAFAVFFASYVFSNRWPPNRLLAFCADISYPLYVVHGIAGYVALRIMLAHGIAPVVALLLALSGALVISWLLHIAVELPTHRLGQHLAWIITHNKDHIGG
jgi:peptidoglycan/LPS O-acetylase OafA/YrhL